MSNADKINALVAQLKRLEAEKFFGDLVLKFKAGELAPDIDKREVVKLGPASR